MVRIVFLMLVVLAKMATIFKAGQAYSASTMKKAAEQEMAEQNIPQEFIKEIMDGVEKKVQNTTITLDDFGIFLLDAANEVKDSVSSVFDDIIDKTMESTSEARNIFATWMRKAADVVDK